MASKQEQKPKVGSRKIDLTKKSAKYAIALREGKSKKEALRVAGYANTNNLNMVERQEGFKEVQRYFADEFKAKMSLEEVADALIDNIKQDGESKKDRNARNGAIKLALERIEPQEKETTEERVLVVLAN